MGVDCNSPFKPWTAGSWQSFSFRSTCCCFPLPYLKDSSKEQNHQNCTFSEEFGERESGQSCHHNHRIFRPGRFTVMKFLPPEGVPQFQQCKGTELSVCSTSQGAARAPLVPLHQFPQQQMATLTDAHPLGLVVD